jgi:hypothetical protein
MATSCLHNNQAVSALRWDVQQMSNAIEENYNGMPHAKGLLICICHVSDFDPLYADDTEAGTITSLQALSRPLCIHVGQLRLVHQKTNPPLTLRLRSNTRGGHICFWHRPDTVATTAPMEKTKYHAARNYTQQPYSPKGIETVCELLCVKMKRNSNWVG